MGLRGEKGSGISGDSMLQSRHRMWLLGPDLGTQNVLARSRLLQEVAARHRGEILLSKVMR